MGSVIFFCYSMWGGGAELVLKELNIVSI
jgi:hypothetical protein